MEKFQKIYQFSMMTDDKNVDELLMMWKTLSEMNSPVEIYGKGTVFPYFSRTFQHYVGMMWKKLLFSFFN